MVKQKAHKADIASHDRFELDGYSQRTEAEILQFRGRAAEVVVALLKRKLQDLHGGLLPDRWSERIDRTPAIEDGKEGTGSVTYRFKMKLLLTVITTISGNTLSIALVTDTEHNR